MKRILGLTSFIACAFFASPASAQREAPERKNPLQQLEQILELKKAIDDAMGADDPQKALDLVMKLQKQMMLQGPNLQFQPLPIPDFQAQGPAPKSDLREQYEKQLKDFADSIEKLKDDKDAREAIEKARDEYKKAMEAELKKADDALPKRIQPAFPAFPQFPRNELLPLQGLDFGMRFPGLNDAQPRLGVQLERISPVLTEQLGLEPGTGLVIVDVMRGLPAEKAGLKKNDIVLEWAGKKTPTDVEAFQTMIAGAKAGEKVEAVVMRKGKKETIKDIELPVAAEVPLRPIPVERGVTNQMQTQINGDKGQVTATVRGVKYDLSGLVEAHKLVPNKIVITDRDETLTFESIEKVPEKYRGHVEKILGRAGLSVSVKE